MMYNRSGIIIDRTGLWCGAHFITTRRPVKIWDNGVVCFISMRATGETAAALFYISRGIGHIYCDIIHHYSLASSISYHGKYYCIHENRFCSIYLVPKTSQKRYVGFIRTDKNGTVKYTDSGSIEYDAQTLVDIHRQCTEVMPVCDFEYKIYRMPNAYYDIEITTLTITSEN